jgi:hypothetical protein
MAERVYIQCKLNLTKDTKPETRPLFLGFKPQPGVFFRHGFAETQIVQDDADIWVVWRPEDHGVWATPAAPYVYLYHEKSGGPLSWATQGSQLTVNAGQAYPDRPQYNFRLDDLHNGFFAFNNSDGSLVMDIKGGATTAGAPVIAWPWGNVENQMWQFIHL